MKKILLLFLFCLTLSGCASRASFARGSFLDSQARIRGLQHSVVALVAAEGERTSNNHNFMSIGKEHDIYCSGVFVAEREVLTAAHCVKRMRIERVSIAGLFEINNIVTLDESPIGDVKKITTYSQFVRDDERLKTYQLYQVDRYDPEKDLALLKVVGSPTMPQHFVVPISDRSLVMGQSVYGMGHGAGRLYSLNAGIVTHLSRRVTSGGVDRRNTQVNNNITGGDSGSPLVTERGELVGLCSSGSTSVSHLNNYVPLRQIRKFLQ